MKVPKRAIVVDSCCDLPEAIKHDPRIRLVPFSLNLNGKEYIDDINMDVGQFVREMAESQVPPKSSCPAPHDYLKNFRDAEEIFVITISANLSTSYNSAVVAVSMTEEWESPPKIHIFDSKSASAGETLLYLHLQKLMDGDLDFSAIVQEENEFLEGMQTLFLLESLEHLAKAGRLKPMVAKVADMLAIKPIMGANSQGEIEAIEKVRGYQRALVRLGQLCAEGCIQKNRRQLVIAHCNCLARAKELATLVTAANSDIEVQIVPTAGLSSTYADDGGIVTAF